MAWPLSAYIAITAEINTIKVRHGIVYYSLSLGLVSVVLGQRHPFCDSPLMHLVMYQKKRFVGK